MYLFQTWNHTGLLLSRSVNFSVVHVNNGGPPKKLFSFPCYKCLVPPIFDENRAFIMFLSYTKASKMLKDYYCIFLIMYSTWCVGQIIQNTRSGGLNGFMNQGLISNLSVVQSSSREYAPVTP